jgi:hypothetical protein
MIGNESAITDRKWEIGNRNAMKMLLEDGRRERISFNESPHPIYLPP